MSEIPLPDPPPTGAKGGLLARMAPPLTLVIAVAAIGLASWEGLENRRHNRLTVQPRLAGEIFAGRDGESERITMAVENTGLGPAVIRSFRLYLDGTLVDANRNRWTPVIDSLSVAGANLEAHGIAEDYFLPAGRRHLLFEMRRPASDTAAAPLAPLLDRLAVDICYCSIYRSDCGRVTVATTVPSLAPCPAPR